MPGQIGCRYALFNAFVQQGDRQITLTGRHPAAQILLRRLPGQVEGMQHQKARLIPGIIGAMAKEQPLFMKATDTPADQITDSAECVEFVHGDDS